jgi:hypothetical protein
LGVPVVPLVSRTIFALLAGLRGRDGAPDSISS